MSSIVPLSFLGSEAFFHEYWQKKPLFLRQAFPNFSSPISENELAGLGCEPFVESRIVLEQGVTPWELRNGPFKAKDFQKLPETHWTLLVQAVNHWMPAVHDLLQHFKFLPSYYLEDVMVSYAVKHGGVGPHFDYYDVFILQGSGKRHWRLGNFCGPETQTLQETPLGILQEFTTQTEYIMEPGDLLYIPQQQAHWCVTQDPGLSYSIGFRTPSHAELLQSFCGEILNQLSEADRLKILPKSTIKNPSEIDKAMLENLKNIFSNFFENSEKLFNWSGRYLTEPKYPDLEKNVVHKKYSNLKKSLSEHVFLQHNESSKFAYACVGGEVYLFVDGESYVFPSEIKDCIVWICDNQKLECKTALQICNTEMKEELVLKLLRLGKLYLEE